MRGSARAALAALLMAGCSSAGADSGEPADDAAPAREASADASREAGPPADAGAPDAWTAPDLDVFEPYADVGCGRSPADYCAPGVLFVCYDRWDGADCPSGTSELPPSVLPSVPDAGAWFCCAN